MHRWKAWKTRRGNDLIQRNHTLAVDVLASEAGVTVRMADLTLP